MVLGVVPELGGRTLCLVLSLFVGLELRADLVEVVRVMAMILLVLDFLGADFIFMGLCYISLTRGNHENRSIACSVALVYHAWHALLRCSHFSCIIFS